MTQSVATHRASAPSAPRGLASEARVGLTATGDQEAVTMSRFSSNRRRYASQRERLGFARHRKRKRSPP
jgi:hypothetical protein